MTQDTKFQHILNTSFIDEFIEHIQNFDAYCFYLEWLVFLAAKKSAQIRLY